MSLIEIDDYDVIIPNSYNYDNYENIEAVDNKIEYSEFFHKFMVNNIPCIVRNINENWECLHKWIKDGQIDHEYLIKTYGHLDAPVANCCDTSHYNSHPKQNMKVCEYMQYLRTNIEKDRHLYLKDWHLRRLLPEDNFYEVPSIFSSDWLNEFAQDHHEDDYMFVYIGPQNTWTPLHVDVYCSYSWSVNILGKKKWILFPPGEEKKIHDKFGNLPLQFTPQLYSNVKSFEIIQEAGDAIFVPSGWYHQVVNLVDTISINHNWINSCNIQKVWEALLNNIISVEQEIAEFKDTEDFPLQCQIILKSLFGMDYAMFTSFLIYIAHKRLNQIKSGDTKGFGNYVIGIKHIKFDLMIIAEILEKISNHVLFKNKDLVSIKIENDLHSTRSSIIQYLNL